MDTLRWGIGILLLLAFVLLSGCVQQTSTQATPSATTIPSVTAAVPQTTPTSLPTLPTARRTTPTSSSGVDQQRCGDNYCNSIERQTGGCPQDCQETLGRPPAATASTAPTQESQVPAETWTLKGYAIDKSVSADVGMSVMMAEVLRLDDGTYRMYYGWAGGGPGQTGIKSAVSSDGRTWTVEAGMRLTGASDESDREAVISGPSVVRLPDGRYRMYYQSSTQGPPNTAPKLHVRSAVSADGLTFTKEGVRIDIAPYSKETGLQLAGHGTYFVAKDGTYVGIFSGEFTGTFGPSELVMGTSKDGLSWGGFRKLYDDWHDPIVLKTENGYVLYATYLLERQGMAVSEDGLNWPAQMTTVAFQDKDGNKLTEDNSGVGDFGGVVTPDGIRLYANWGKLSSDIAYFEKTK